MRDLFLETSVIIAYLRGTRDIRDFIDKYQGSLCASVISIAELYEGVYRSNKKHRQKTKRGVDTFFKALDKVFEID